VEVRPVKFNPNLHKPVLIKTIQHFLDKESFLFLNSIVFDGTLGGGGYTEFFLKRGANVHTCDLDLEAVENCQNHFKKYLESKKIELVNLNFAKYIKHFPDNFFDIIVLDLGFSSNQLEFSKRGFSHQKDDEILDLRYDSKEGSAAWEKIKNLKSSSDLAKIIYRNSGESFSRKIAKNLYQLVRSKKNSETLLVQEVKKEVLDSLPAGFSNFYKKQALSRVWQSMRVWVNKETEVLDFFLKQAIKRLKKDGFLIVVSFNTLEDKLVTSFMRRVSRPIFKDEYGNTKQNFVLKTKKALTPNQEELINNPRSRSALLRVLKKV